MNRFHTLLSISTRAATKRYNPAGWDGNPNSSDYDEELWEEERARLATGAPNEVGTELPGAAALWVEQGDLRVTMTMDVAPCGENNDCRIIFLARVDPTFDGAGPTTSTDASR